MAQRLQVLDDIVWKLKGLALEQSTQRSYATHRSAYAEFCGIFGFQLVPITQIVAARYVAYLSQRLSVASIKKYLNIIRIIHLENSLPDPEVLQMYEVQNVLMGLSKEMGTATRRMEPITPIILMRMLQQLDLSCLDDQSVWAACLLGFFGLLRRSNLFPPTIAGFKSDKHLSRLALAWTEGGIKVSLQWTKTLQCREKVLSVLLVAAPGHALCPVQAINNLLSSSQDIPPASPMFWRKGKYGLTPITYSWFSDRLKQLLRGCGVDPSLYGTHSLRRGGATWAFRCGLSAEAIQMLGHWKSDAYKVYLELAQDLREIYMHRLMEQLPPCD